LLLQQTSVEQGTPEQYLYVLHGIFGSGRNWASVARRLVQERPEWGVRLIDLRQHGASQGFEGPHTIASAARDLEQLAESLSEQPAGLLGHSFGGKVALMYARVYGQPLKQIWVIDSTPDVRPPSGSAWQMLGLIRQAPREFEARQDLVAYLSEQGMPLGVGQWMATNLEQSDGLYRWRFDLESIEALLTDFFKVDLWDVIESPPPNATLNIVKARESNVLTPEAVRKIESVARRNARVHFHEVAGGHWVNAENPEELHRLLVADL
jgi:esterase